LPSETRCDAGGDRHAAQTVGAHDFIMRLEDGYETQLGERGSRLSLGQRQLIAFARALLADPRILILDEATSSVDIGTERKIERALQLLLEKRTAFIIAHRLSTIRDGRPDRGARARPRRRAGIARRAAGRTRAVHVALWRLGVRRRLGAVPRAPSLRHCVRCMIVGWFSSRRYSTVDGSGSSSVVGTK